MPIVASTKQLTEGETMNKERQSMETKTKEYTGIDYGLGRSNIDKETGIRYGVISQHSINPDALQDIELEYGEPTCPECGEPVKESEDNKDYQCKEHGTFWGDDCFHCEPIGMSYESEGYRITDCLDSDLFILKSPYFTRGQFCSPCVPGAVNLDNPMESGAKAYCLGHDWFEGGRAPYPVYSVETGEMVEA